MSPSVSILVRACNVSRFLPAALSSICAQDYTDWEALILDDASEDNIRNVIEPWITQDPRFVYIRNATRLGRPGNLNRGIAHARGRYMAVLDGDDLWRDSATLTKLIRTLQKHPDAILIAASAVEINEQGKFIRYFPNGHHTDHAIRARILIENIIAHNSVCYRRKDVQALGGYNEALCYTEDYELWLRMGLHGKFFILPDYLASYRIHQKSIGIRRRQRQILEELKVIWRYRHTYPHIFLALINRFMALGASCIQKKIRRAIAHQLHYHTLRIRFVDSVASFF